jgi:hypothetical protein
MDNGILGSMGFNDLWRMRNAAQGKESQNAIAPYEHRAFAREATQENPLSALSLALGIPAYQLAKLLGLTDSRSDPSLEQMKQGYIGVGEGLLSRMR